MNVMFRPVMTVSSAQRGRIVDPRCQQGTRGRAGGVHAPGGRYVWTLFANTSNIETRSSWQPQMYECVNECRRGLDICERIFFEY